MTDGGRLLQAVRELHPDWRLGALRRVGGGLVFDVFRGDSPVLGSLALRVARTSVLRDSNDADVDTRDLLEQEVLLIEHARRHGIPCPPPIALHCGGDLDFLVSEFVESDGTRCDEREVGELVARVHRAPPPVARTVEQGDLDAEDMVVERLVRRFGNLLARTDVKGSLPGPPVLSVILGDGGPRSLLHMDVRPDNLLAREGRVAALLDWDNAVIGSPALELARIAEYGALGDDFLLGYRASMPPAPVSRAAELVYRLDTAVMLANVFLSHRPGEVAVAQVGRVAELLGALDEALA